MASDRDPGVIGDLIETYCYPVDIRNRFGGMIAARKGKTLNRGIIIRRHVNSNWIIFWPKYNLMKDLAPYDYEVISEGRKENDNAEKRQ